MKLGKINQRKCTEGVDFDICQIYMYMSMHMSIHFDICILGRDTEFKIKEGRE